jgi:hypothetical protein
MEKEKKKERRLMDGTRANSLARPVMCVLPLLLSFGSQSLVTGMVVDLRLHRVEMISELGSGWNCN